MAYKIKNSCESCEEDIQDDGGILLKIQIHQILDYFKNSVRPLREGENIVDAGWIYSLGTIGSKEKKVVGNVFQTTHMSDRPHEVILENLSHEVSRWKCRCSCKAGIGEKCKHIAACLISIQKTPRLYELSSTQLRQKWGKIGKEMASAHGGIEIKNMCHVLQKINVHGEEVVSEEMKKKILSIGLEAFPDSEFGRMKRCYRSSYLVQQPAPEDSNMDEFYELVFTEGLFLKKFVPELEKYLSDQATQKIFEENIKKNKKEAIEICKKTNTQSCFTWLQERKIRITGSISYGLFTYLKNKNPDWKKKVESTFFNTFKGNEATRYGQQSEKEAKEVYRKLYLLFDCGLVISPTLSCFAVSPDGLSYNGEEWKLVEIKSPLNGKLNSAKDLLPDLKYLKTENGCDYKLKERHEYFGQIQLGLFVLGLETCDLVIYSSFTISNIVIIDVKKDYNFLEMYIPCLMGAYFDYILKNMI